MMKALSPRMDSHADSLQLEVNDKMSTSDSVETLKKSIDYSTPKESGTTITSGTNDSKNRNDNLEEILTWIDRISFSRPRRNLARDFSDGVFMAELLKRYYPRHVDLHNYVSRSSVANKIDNWNTLNRKVLSKIGMKLGKGMINRLAYSEPGCIEIVLTDLRGKILKDCNADRDSLYFNYEENHKGETVKSVLNSEEIANTTVPRRAFVKLKRELDEKKSAVSMLGDKVSHLESLIELKDQRIADLTMQITGTTLRHSIPRCDSSGDGSAKSANETPRSKQFF